jgi:hypothetical protein
MNSVLAGFLIMTGIVFVYLLPAWVAVLRKLPNSGGVLIINMLLGWTFFGWVWALVMACASKPKRGRYAPGAYAPGYWPR